jgi:hypothetical protein
VVKLSYHHRHERAGRHLQLLRFPPPDNTMNRWCYISVTAGSYAVGPINPATGGENLLSLAPSSRVAHRINDRRW